MTNTLDSFGLTEKEKYQQWWIERQATNHTVWTDRYDKIMERIPVEPQRILEIGCQTGGFTIPLLQRGHEVTAVDIVPMNLDRVGSIATRQNVRPRLTTLLSFAEDLEFEEEFDLVLLCEVLIHCRDDEEVLRRAIRAAKPKGRVIVTVPWFDLFQGVEISRYYDFEQFSAMVMAQKHSGCWFASLKVENEENPHTLMAEITK